MTSEEAIQTFVFADLAGFTALTEAHGDEQAADLIADFLACARRQLEGSGVEEVKTIGDALMLRAALAADAMRLAVRLSAKIQSRTGFPGIRIGMHSGPAVERDGDWFGSAVNIAARVAGVAASGDILLTEATRSAGGEIDEVELTSAGRAELRGVSEPMRIYRASPATEHSEQAWPIDPVCRMAVDPRLAAGSLSHDGQIFHFCSLECAAKFASQPGSFAS